MQLLSEETKIKALDSALACAEQMLDALPPVTRFVRRHMRGNRSKGLSVPQFRTLVLLRSAPAVNLSVVAEFLDVSLPTTSRIVSGLVDHGLVQRRERPCDRRQIELEITPDGSAALESARQATQSKLATELVTLSESDRQAIAQAMQALQSLFAPHLRQAAEGTIETPVEQVKSSSE